MENWKEYSLQEVTTRIGDGLHGTPVYDDNGSYYFINGSNLLNGKVVINENTKRVSTEQYEKHKKELSDRTVLLGINGTIGNVALYQNEKCILGKSAAYLNVKEDFDKLFLKYVLLNPHFQNFIQVNATGTTIKNVGLGLLRSYKFLAPESKTEQQKIASILSSLDDKIELNNQMNQTLEQIAQAIFKEWFVDFNFPGFDGNLVDGLPKGWRKESIDKNINYLNGLALQKYPVEDGEDYLPVIKIRELRQGVTSATDKANFSVPENYIIKNGDILFSWSGSLDIAIWNYGTGALNQHLFKVSSNTYPKWFYYFWTKHFLPIYRNIAASKATTMGHIQRRHLTESLINVPDEKILKKADEVIKPLFDRLLNNAVQCSDLAEIRNNLLSKLLNGNIKPTL